MRKCCLFMLVYKKLVWENIGINMDGKYLSHLRFADNVILINSDLAQLKVMMEQLNSVS